MHIYNIVRARVRQRVPQVYLPVCEKESSTRADPVSLDIGYRSGREPLSFRANECILRIAGRTTGSLRFPSLPQDSRGKEMRVKEPLRVARESAFRTRFIGNIIVTREISLINESKDF